MKVSNDLSTSALEHLSGDEKLWEVSKQFESMFLHQMMKSMRETVAYDEESEPSQGRQVFTEMLDQQYAESAAEESKKSKSGLAAVLFRYLNREQEANSSSEYPLRPLPEITKPIATNVSIKNSAMPDTIERWDSHIQSAAKEFNVPVGLIKSMMYQESRGNEKAESPVGAKGLMQLMDSTAKDLGVKNSFDPQENIRGGVKYLRQMLDRFHGNLELSLAAYNAGPTRVEKFNGVPPFRETQNYIRDILQRWNSQK